MSVIQTESGLQLGTGRRSLMGLAKKSKRALPAAAFLCALPLSAQVATGDILGTVTDSTGSIIPGASIRVENVGTHEVRTFTTKGTGEYTFSALQPGTYSVTVTSPSFKAFTTSNIVVSASDRVRIDAKLQLGSVNEVVEVEATPTALQTDSTTVGSTITEKTLVDAPLNGRNYIGLVQVQAGVNAGTSNSLALLNGGGQTDRRLSASVSANGQQEIFNNNLVDGLDNNSRLYGAPLIRPSIEAIAEVRTDINLYTAEVGRTGGAAINVITKSGVNQFHGSAYEFFRNDLTDTRNFFATANVIPRKPELRQNQFGGSLGGPIFRDKTFFFVDYEGFRRIDGNNSVFINTVPTAAERATPGYLADITNPFTGVALTNLPAVALNPTTLAYFKLFPAPNLPGSVNNFVYNPTSSLYSSTGDLRIDHHLSTRDTFFGRYSYNRTTSFFPPSFPNANGVAAGGSLQGTGGDIVITHNGQLGYTHIFSPSLLLEVKGGYTFFTNTTIPLNNGRNLNDQAPYLIPNANECISCSGLATVDVLGYGVLGDSVAEPTLDIEHNTLFGTSLTYVRGRQAFKVGAGVVRRNFSDLNPVTPKGAFIFPVEAVAASKLYLPSLELFLLGAPYASQRQAFTTKPYDTTWEPSAFFQDDWRVTDKLTLNLGVRYEIFTQPNAKYNNYANFDLASLSLVSNGTGGVQTEHHDFSPRFGFDATIAPKTVLRGGFGLAYFVSDSTNGIVLNNPPLGFNLPTTVNFTPISTTGVAPVVPQSTAFATLSGGVVAKQTHPNDSYLEQFNLLLQREFGATVVTVGYVAELGRHINDTVPNLDIPAPAGPLAPPSPAPFATQLPHVTGISYIGNFGASSYNSFQASVERRISHGLTGNFNYTFSHNLDDVIQVFDGDGLSNNGFGDLPSQISTYDYGNSPLDTKSRFAGFFSYDLPFGKSGSNLYKRALGGFRLNGLGFWQTGGPFTVTSSVTQANGLATINLPTVTIDRPNLVGSPNSGSGVSTNQQLQPATAFNINAFAQQTVGTPGNERRNQLFGPHIRRGDLSLFKTIPVYEKVQLELRGECFNITNTPNFSAPNAVLGSAGFGTITSTATNYSGRQFQFAGRLSF